ncbi:hypothetical protein J2N67_006628 (plasmid) [Bacillus thuringiensis]|uniref:YopX family protein n=1 Tax=Bacillus thuringiensis TaxID=1428 RepID=UPI00208E75BA|nr:YopX family protein [Bacillus thuringiensis]USP56379.1 hypothetical protein J2N67_006628 [Bacillus thuringiensis]
MKIIEFRAWDINRKEMIYIDDLYFFEEEGIHEIVDGIAKGHHAEYKIMQHTGLKGTEGKKIFEGDIVKNAFGEEYKIIWDEKRCQFIAVTTIEDGSEWYQNVSRSLEVIGNIYENLTK